MHLSVLIILICLNPLHGILDLLKGHRSKIRPKTTTVLRLRPTPKSSTTIGKLHDIQGYGFNSLPKTTKIITTLRTTTKKPAKKTTIKPKTKLVEITKPIEFTTVMTLKQPTYAITKEPTNLITTTKKISHTGDHLSEDEILSDIADIDDEDEMPAFKMDEMARGQFSPTECFDMDKKQFCFMPCPSLVKFSTKQCDICQCRKPTLRQCDLEACQ
ncbi:uncharacterized protein LOC123293829 [Chrysoperla carnea]|uniref:uncharacterized protein LOC123293829 n=1 Tax=Chrysoperla carnea TaxID=189513 RepID=UPI001D084C51|nr:uncharacterized protein LOC123293829 [Chrysoperla carnea]